jgi:hypothetical protein
MATRSWWRNAGLDSMPMGLVDVDPVMSMPGSNRSDDGGVGEGSRSKVVA